MASTITRKLICWSVNGCSWPTKPPKFIPFLKPTPIASKMDFLPSFLVKALGLIEKNMGQKTRVVKTHISINHWNLAKFRDQSPEFPTYIHLLFWILKSLKKCVWHKHMMLGWIEIMIINSTSKNMLNSWIPVLYLFIFIHIFSITLSLRKTTGWIPSPHIPETWRFKCEAHSMSRAVRVLQDVDPRCVDIMKIAHLWDTKILSLDWMISIGRQNVNVVI